MSDHEYKPQKLRRKRDESYNTGRAEMNKKLDKTSSGTPWPRELWFLVGVLGMGFLYILNVFTPSWRQLPPP